MIRLIRQYPTIALVIVMILLSVAFLIWGLAMPKTSAAACDFSVATSCP